MQATYPRILLGLAFLVLTTDRATAGFTLRIESSSPTASVGGTLDLRVYLQESGGTILADEGLISAGIRVRLDAGMVTGGTPSGAFSDPLSPLPPFVDFTAAGSTATLYVLADPLVTVFPSSNEILLGTFTVGGWADPGPVTATVEAPTDPLFAYTATGGLPDPRVLDGDIRSGTASIEVLGPGGGVQPVPAPGGLGLLASAILPLIGSARGHWRGPVPNRPLPG